MVTRSLALFSAVRAHSTGGGLVKELSAAGGYGGERPAWRGALMHALHVFVVGIAHVDVAFITRRYALRIFHSGGFARLQTASGVSHTLTVCLEPTGIVPHSLITLYNGSNGLRYLHA